MIVAGAHNSPIWQNPTTNADQANGASFGHANLDDAFDEFIAIYRAKFADEISEMALRVLRLYELTLVRSLTRTADRSTADAYRK